MGYCTAEDVQAEFKNLELTTTGFVTSETVDTFITEASALIDSKVGRRWVIPVTGNAESLALLSLFCRTLVADRVRGILANKQQTNTDPNKVVKSDGYSVRDVMKALEDIRLGNMVLPGAELLNSNASMFSNNSSMNVQPRFRKGYKQW